MKVEKSGGRTKNPIMLTVQCTICGMDMDCPFITSEKETVKISPWRD